MICQRIRVSCAAYRKLKNVLSMKLPLKMNTKTCNKDHFEIANKPKSHGVDGPGNFIEKPTDERMDKTKLEDIISRVAFLKWNWAGHGLKHQETQYGSARIKEEADEDYHNDGITISEKQTVLADMESRKTERERDSKVRDVYIMLENG